MAAKKKEDMIEVLMEHEPIPENAVTFGKLISQALNEKQAEIELTAKQKAHAKLYDRWKRMALRHVSKRFPAEHEIFTDVRVWELYVCRFPDEAVLWFYQITSEERIDLCILSRRLRVNAKR